MLVSVLVFFLLVSSTLGEQVCPRGFDVEYSEMCLRFHTSSHLAQAVAGNTCALDRAIMLPISSTETFNAIRGLLPDTQAYWIGVRWAGDTIGWRSTDGVIVDFQTWSRTPDTTNSEYCATMKAASVFWEPSVCSMTNPFVCQTQKVEATCEANWTLIKEEVVCVKTIQKYRRTFEAARTACQEMGAELAMSLNSEVEIKMALSNITHREHFWIGVRQPASPGDFENVDGTLLTNRPFKEGRPILSNGNFCVSVKKNNWYDKNCNRRQFYICQKPATIT